MSLESSPDPGKPGQRWRLIDDPLVIRALAHPLRHRLMSVIGGLGSTPEGRGAVDVLEQILAEQTLESFLDWQQRRANWPEAWQEPTGIGQSTVWLTQPELSEITAAFEALLLRYIDERPIDAVASRPPGSVPVNFTLFTVPGSEPPEPDPPEADPEEDK
jgi:hypothetical protein